LAPQLRQSLKILQVAALDLRSTIQEELQNNPTLEELPLEAMSLERNGSTAPDADSAPTNDASDSREELQFERNFEVLNKIDQDWRDHMSQAGSGSTFTQEDAERRQHFFDSLVGDTSL